MEDGIENNMTTIYNYITNNTNNTNNIEKKTLYVYMPENMCLEKIFITDNLQNAIIYSKRKNGKIQLFENDINDIYYSKNDCYLTNNTIEDKTKH